MKLNNMSAGEFEHPDWQAGSKVHNWRKYASEDLISAWSGFSTEQKKIIAENLQDIADEEEWD